MLAPKSPIAITSESTQNLVEVTTRKWFIDRRKKKITTILLPIFIILFVVFLILFIVYNTKYRKLLEEKVCTSEDCIDSANMFLKIMDRQKDPCTDFYAYACGNFAQEHPIIEGDIYRSFFDEAEDRLTRMVTQIFQKPNSVTISKAFDKTKDFYTSCMDTGLLDELEFQPLYDLLDKVGLPKFPTADAASHFNLGKTLGQIQRYLSMDILVALTIDQGQLRHGEANDTFILKIGPIAGNPSGGAIQDPDISSLLKVLRTKMNIRNDPTKWDMVQSKSPEKVLSYVIRFITQIIQLLLSDLELEGDSVPNNETEIVTDVLKILKFAGDLNQMITEYSNGTEAESMTFAELESMLDNVSRTDSPGNKILLKDYVNEVFSGETGYWTYDYNNDLVSVEYVENLKNLWMFLKSRKPITIMRFVWWHVVVEFAKFTTEEMYEPYRRLYDSIAVKRGGSRERICINYVRTLYPLTIAKEVKTVFGLANQTQKAEEMLNDIKDEFENLVYAAEWLDQPTKWINVDKTRSVSEFIGYEKEVLDEKSLDEFYNDLKIDKREYLMNMARTKEWEMLQGIQILRQANSSILGPLHEAVNPIEVNAYYAHVKNTIYVPAGILQRPFYFRGLESLNYGAIGSILGHELTHGFDSLGSHFDKNGNFLEQNWPEPIIDRYDDRAQCFIDQYSTFNLSKKERLDGKHTLAENIADNGGLRESYYAYQTFVKKHGKELKLPGFEDFTHEQLLFLSFATVWCEANTEKYEKAVSRDTHSPNRVRVLGTLQNMKEFSQAFQCPSGSFMNPSKKCIIW